MRKRAIEEILELIWTIREEGSSSHEVIVDKTSERNPEKLLETMVAENLIRKERSNVILTKSGEEYAKLIVRRHRLAERLFKDVFQLDEESLEKEACTWEHVLSPDVTESVCSFLGHPRVCPHNKPIPPGNCCYKYKHAQPLRPLVQPLDAIDVGFWVKIVYILPSLQKRLERLTSFGIIPGAILKVSQKSPALVVICEESTIALDKNVGSEIYVKALNDT